MPSAGVASMTPRLSARDERIGVARSAIELGGGRRVARDHDAGHEQARDVRARERLTRRAGLVIEGKARSGSAAIPEPTSTISAR